MDTPPLTCCARREAMEPPGQPAECCTSWFDPCGRPRFKGEHKDPSPQRLLIGAMPACGDLAATLVEASEDEFESGTLVCDGRKDLPEPLEASASFKATMELKNPDSRRLSFSIVALISAVVAVDLFAYRDLPLYPVLSYFFETLFGLHISFLARYFLKLIWPSSGRLKQRDKEEEIISLSINNGEIAADGALTCIDFKSAVMESLDNCNSISVFFIGPLARSLRRVHHRLLCAKKKVLFSGQSQELHRKQVMVFVFCEH